MRITLHLLLIACLALPPLTALAGARAPLRVVSMNLCTDQLALMLAAPGQLLSVSDWAARPEASNLADEAAALPLNSGDAERIYLMQPDLVLAGAYTNHATVAMLRRLGLRVEIFGIANSVDEVGANIRRLGRLLGREVEAGALAARFEAELGRLADRAAALPPRDAAYHYPNNYTSGAGTLAHDVLTRAGFRNAVTATGLGDSTRIEIETLVMLEPFLIRTSHISGNHHGRSYEPLRHPALREMEKRTDSAVIDGRWQICGTPFVTLAVEALITARRGR